MPSGQTTLLLPSGGTLTLAAQDSAVNNTATLPANSGTVVTTGSTGVVTQAMMGAGVAGNGPAFSAYLSAAQAAPTVATWTKVALDSTEFNTAGFDTTNKYFKPPVAGYYQFNALVSFTTSQTGINSIALYKNGNLIKQGQTGIASQIYRISYSGLVYMNGSTDYLELYVYCSNTSTLDYSTSGTNLSGFLARSA